ncbi:hypothetical protein PGT21_001972 [Puccinia graminis f. sp. tritici]|uniref:Uncharacterized protein n=1 Tax=Puccinia graminis f. sp. tritici TaxID=56615 RepID=A0A5B0QZY4_PUCGR|nr:hypothetical protein PGT21_001972 [Puccinia graminis f. sp. tritici]
MKRDQFWEHAAKHFNENSPGGHREGKDLSTRCDEILRDIRIHQAQPTVWKRDTRLA